MRFFIFGVRKNQKFIKLKVLQPGNVLVAKEGDFCSDFVLDAGQFFKTMLWEKGSI